MICITLCNTNFQTPLNKGPGPLCGARTEQAQIQGFSGPNQEGL